MNDESPQVYQGIGTLLARARHQHDLDMEMVANRLHIRRRYLEAIETGELDALPGDAYARGYVRSYARFLGLDSEEAVACFNEELSGVPTNKRHRFIPEPTVEGYAPGRGTVILSVVAALLIYVCWWLMVEPSPPPRTETPPLPDHLVPYAGPDNDAEYRLSPPLPTD